MGRFAAVVLAGGTGARLGGADKATIEHAGRSLLEHALAALARAVEVVVVGDPVPTSRPVTFVREDPPLGGPAAGLLAGRDALQASPPVLAVLAVDMPLVGPETFVRLLEAAAGHEGAFLTDARGKRQLAGVLDVSALDRVRPGSEREHGLPVHRLLQALDLVAVPALGAESRDVDTWADLRDLGDPPGDAPSWSRCRGCGPAPSGENVDP